MSIDKRTMLLKDATRAMVTQNLLDVAGEVADANEQLRMTKEKLKPALATAKVAGISVAQMARLTGLNSVTIIKYIQETNEKTHGID